MCAVGQQSADDLSTLRAEYDKFASANVPAAQWIALAHRVSARVDGSNDANDRLSAIKLLAAICFQTPTSELESARERVLQDLAKMAPTSGRARAMLHGQTLPPIHREPSNAERSAMLARFEARIDRLIASTSDEQTRADLLYLRCLPRIEIHRACIEPRIDAAQSARLDEALERLSKSKFEAPAGGSYAQLVEGIRRDFHETTCGKALANLEAAGIDGKTIRLTDYRGECVVLTFWSTWCVPCLQLVPHEAELLRKLGPRGVVLIGVNSDPTTAQALRTAAEKDMNWPQIWSPPGSPSGLVARLGIQQWPSVVILGPSGEIRGKFVGSIYQTGWTMADVERALLDILPSN